MPSSSWSSNLVFLEMPDREDEVTTIPRYSDSLADGRSGDRVPVDGEIFRTRPDRPWDPPSLLYNKYQVISRGKATRAWR